MEEDNHIAESMTATSWILSQWYIQKLYLCTYEYTQWMGQRCPSDSDTVTCRVDVHICDMSLVPCMQEWTKLEGPKGVAWPVERVSHAACCLNYGEEHPQLLVTGGVDKNDNTLQDAWILDVNSGRWREVSNMNVWLAGSTD